MSGLELRLAQVDVFENGPLTGNPVAVVDCRDDASGDGGPVVADDVMQDFARWTNLSETTFVLPPSDDGAAAGADYRLRIFTPGRELPFAGHPTLGSAHAWLEAGGVPRAADGSVVQECGAGLVRLRRGEEGLAFAAPPFLRFGPPDAADVEQALRGVRIGAERLLDAHWIDNGPGWLGLRLASADDVLAARPDAAAMGDLRIGLIGAHDPDGPADVEVRAFAGAFGIGEDPVTGSLNAGFAVWLSGSGALPPSYVARQGTRVGRDGRVRLETTDGTTWVGGATRTVVTGSVSLPSRPVA